MLKNSTGKQAGESVQPTPYESILRQEGRAIHSEDSSVDPDRIPVFLSGVSTSERYVSSELTLFDRERSAKTDPVQETAWC